MLVRPVVFEELKRTYVRTSINNFVLHMECDVVMTSSTYQDDRPGVVLNRAQFCVDRPNSFQSVNKNKPKKGKILALWY